MNSTLNYGAGEVQSNFHLKQKGNAFGEILLDGRDELRIGLVASNFFEPVDHKLRLADLCAARHQRFRDSTRAGCVHSETPTQLTLSEWAPRGRRGAFTSFRGITG